MQGMTEDQLDKLVRDYSGMLLGVCSLLLGDRHLAQDMVQETFLRAWKTCDLQRNSEKSWLIRVAVNLCHDVHRSRWWRHTDRRITPEQLSMPAPSSPDPEIISLVKQLPMKEKEVILLHFWQGLPAEEIAAALGITRSAVYRRLDKAKKHLRLELEGGVEHP